MWHPLLTYLSFLLLGEVNNIHLTQYDVGAIVQLLADCMVDSKENIDDNFIASFRDRNLVTIRALVEDFIFILP